MDTKTCSICNENKDINLFYFKNKKLNQRHSACIECTKIYRKNYYQDNIVHFKTESPIYSKKMRDRNMQFVVDFLKMHPCIDCGEPDPVVLEFDHMKDKIVSVTTLVGKCCSIETIKLEIEKCEVRCANCHRRKTALQLSWYKDIIF